ncbi:MAG: multicomponent Na+:H+ antiporter subunit [Clostridiales bacterium]|jgi:multicomponent Na+:H+ antiporter subunit B|nr:multicomponent Na+:H+ antiporter subunit [Clostridiales bacterium]MDN5297595.1 multicomponent Na+:H+ antiporter subunit [Clostridiales bacterium]
MNEHSDLTATTLGFIYPLFIIYGLYIIFNGHISPGGGFQGGAVLSAMFISKYLILPLLDTPLAKIQKVEKLLLLLIVATPILFLLTRFNASHAVLNTPYLILMNTLIGFKVACGMSVIFLRFVFYEMQ